MNAKRMIAVCGAAILVMVACGKPQEEAAEKEAVAPVEVAEAKRGTIERVISADAILFPVNQANVTPKISAPVRRVLVNRGDHVKAGQLLAELESRDLVAAANDSKAQWDQAVAALRGKSAITSPA